jgi:hypothetical protein
MARCEERKPFVILVCDEETPREGAMCSQSPFSTNQFHHIALCVADAGVNKAWLTMMLGFGVTREFHSIGMHFFPPMVAKSPVIELIGGAVEAER